MKTHQLNAIKRDLSALCLGTMNFGDSMSEELSFEVMDAFVAMGGNFIDTARVYGASSPSGMGAAERVIGKWLRARGNRDQITLSTKGGHPPIGKMHTGRLDKASLTEDLEKSMDALGVDTIDIYWLHRDDESLPIKQILTTLESFIEERKVLALGASNWRPARLREAADNAREMGLTGFCADQPLWSLAHAQNIADSTLYQMDAELFSVHARSHMACMPYTSQAKGFFAKMETGGAASLSEKGGTRYLSDHNLALFHEAQAIGRENGLSAGAVALAFLTHQPQFPVFPIVGVSSLAQANALEEAANAVLTPDQLKRLMALTALAPAE